jgi:hypothetical protein
LKRDARTQTPAKYQKRTSCSFGGKVGKIEENVLENLMKTSLRL